MLGGGVTPPPPLLRHYADMATDLYNCKKAHTSYFMSKYGSNVPGETHRVIRVHHELLVTKVNMANEL